MHEESRTLAHGVSWRGESLRRSGQLRLPFLVMGLLLSVGGFYQVTTIIHTSYVLYIECIILNGGCLGHLNTPTNLTFDKKQSCLMLKLFPSLHMFG
jgi:hypothetical protein